MRKIRRWWFRITMTDWYTDTRLALWRMKYRGLMPYVVEWEKWQQYGGPEEGGWWFDCGRPIWFKRVPFFIAPLLRWHRARLLAGFDFPLARYNRDATEYGDTHDVCIEPHYPNPYPMRRPHYE